MKNVLTTTCVLLGGALALAFARPPARPSSRPAASPVVVGTYDSRGVVLAWVGSTDFQTYLSAQKEDVGRALERARETGDRELATELEALGPAMQRRIHQQGFGNAPIDDLLARIHDRLPEIAARTGVDVIVSKWELDWQRPGVVLVDVTEELAAEFHPDERTWKGIREIVTKDPVPLDQLEEDRH